MESRHEKLRRLAAVQRQLEHLAEIELAGLNRQRAFVEERIDSLIEALASPNPVHTGFSRLYGGQIGLYKARDQVLSGRVRLQETRLLTERTRTERLEERSRLEAQAEARAREDDAVLDILDCLGALSTQASRKLHHR